MNQKDVQEKNLIPMHDPQKPFDKKHLLVILLPLILIVLLLSLMKKEPDDRIALPLGSKDCTGSNYEDVLGRFRDAGFTNVETKAIDDLVLGWLAKDGEIEEVEVDGHTTFSANAKYLPEVKIVITYHTFPEKESPASEPSAKPAEPEKTPSSQSEKLPEPSSESREEPSQSVSDPEPVKEENLTVENCPALRDMLAIKGDNDPFYAEFAETYKGKIIEFDGCIIDIAPHQNNKTRYDLLVWSGDYVDPNTINPGPYFQLSNVQGSSISSFGDTISVGSNVHIVAEVEGYNSSNFIFSLSPEEIVER